LSHYLKSVADLRFPSHSAALVRVRLHKLRKE
jgi:hypothetical protein